MDRRKKEKRNRKIIIIVTTGLVVFSVVSLFIGRTGTSLEAMLKDSVAVIEYYVVKKPIEFVGDIFSEFASLQDVYEENAILKEKLENYTSLASRYKALEDEVKELKEITGIDYLPTEYTSRPASIISRSSDSWNNEVTIGIGTAGGVEVDMAVVSSKGMIGVVTSTTEVTATVTLLTSEKTVNEIPVQIKNGDQDLYGLLDKYDVKTGTYEVTLFDTIDKLEENATVTTSGKGGKGKCPKGILIGTATEVSLKADGTTTKLYIKPAAQFTDLNYVAVVQQKVTGDE